MDSSFTQQQQHKQPAHQVAGNQPGSKKQSPDGSAEGAPNHKGKLQTTCKPSLVASTLAVSSASIGAQKNGGLQVLSSGVSAAATGVSNPIKQLASADTTQLQRRQDCLPNGLDNIKGSNSVEKVLDIEARSDQIESVSNQMTPYGGVAHCSGSAAGVTTGKSINSDGVDRRQSNFLGVSQSIGSTNQGTSKGMNGNHVNQLQKPSIKIDGNGVHQQNGSISTNQNRSWHQSQSGVGPGNGRFQGHSQNRDQARRKRKSSEKIQRRASNVRKNEPVLRDLDQNMTRKEMGAGAAGSHYIKNNQHHQQFHQGNVNQEQLTNLNPQQPSANGIGPTSSSLTRSQSRGTNGPSNSQMQPPNSSQQNQTQNGHLQGESNHSGDPFHTYSNTHGLSDEEQIQQNSFGAHSNPKNSSISNGNTNLNGQSFPFVGQPSQIQIIPGQNQAPQVHFIAKKQQFIAQISPEQLHQSDKRPYTAQSLNGIQPAPTSTKKAAQEYTNTYTSKGAQFGSTYHISTAAFKAHNKNYIGHKGNGGASKTHTSGFSFHPPMGNGVHKYSNSMFGSEEMHISANGKPKLGSKDIVHLMSQSNGFNSVQSSQDPYNSMMSGSGGALGLPVTMVYSNKSSKSKANYSRLQTKEKEQLYDETIKMKVLNNQLKDESVKLKTKIKILENELGRKEKTIEDLFNHNQMIHQQQSQNKNSQQANSSFSFMPIASTQQKYQQETFLVMSLKKQVRELKFEVLKREEELEVLRKNIRNTKTKELEQEITSYKEECIRQRAIIEDLFKQGTSHPVHQQALTERINQMQSELQLKDQMLSKMKDQMNQSMKIDMTAFNSNSSNANKSSNNLQVQQSSGVNSVNPGLGSMSLTALATQDNNANQLQSSPSGGDITHKPKPTNTPQTTQQSFYPQQVTQASREKSADRKTTSQSYQAQQLTTKDLQRDLQRTKRTVRDKDKEIMKLRSDINTLKRETNEKLKTENIQQKDNESQLKHLREKQRDLRMDLKRKDDKISDVEIRFKRLEDQFREVQQTLKGQEEQNKQLKSQLRTIKLSQKVQNKTTEAKSRNLIELNVASSKDEKKDEKTKDTDKEKATDIGTNEIVALKSVPSEPDSIAQKKTLSDTVKSELKLISLMGLREKFSRDELTSMMTSSESGLRMLIKNPSEELINFVKANLYDEDQIVIAIPRYDIPRAEFETQVLREMRLVLRENQQTISEKSKEELMKWTEFIQFYQGLQNFEYPHKDKLLDFINYFFLDYIDSVNELYINYQAFQDHITAKRLLVPSSDRTRNSSALVESKKTGEQEIRSESTGASNRKKMLGLSMESDRADDEKMHNIAEQCFMRISDLLYQQKKTVKQVFMKFSEPEPFKNGQVLDLVPPKAFIKGVKELGFDDIQEIEINALMKVLSKPELDGAIILNEFIHIMESFGIPPFSEEDEFENDYIADSDNEKEVKLQDQKFDAKDNNIDDLDKDKQEKNQEKIQETKILAEGIKNLDDQIDKIEKLKKEKENEEDIVSNDGIPTNSIKDIKKRAAEAAKSSKMKQQINIDFDILDEKGIKILKRLSRFLLERYMHPREFYGPTIKTEIIGKRKNKVEIIKLHDFYLRLKLASIRKKLKEIPSINKCFAIDGEKYPGLIQVKRMIKALELIAEGEQEIMAKEHQIQMKEKKEKAEQIAKERAEKGLPPLDLEEEEAKNKQEDEKKMKDKSLILDITAKDGKASGESQKAGGMLSEVLKLGGGSGLGSRSSPSNSKERDGPKYGTAGIGGPSVQLNTIEEDLHETQTSHYSQMVKEGDFTDREGSKHQISTSNYLRNSNAQAEMLEDSARRSLTATGIKTPILDDTSCMMMEGALSNGQKGTHKSLNVRNSLPGCNDTSGYNLMDPDEEIDVDQNINDELVAEVDKQYQKQLASSQNEPDMDQEHYEDDFENDEQMKNLIQKSQNDEEEYEQHTLLPDQSQRLNGADDDQSKPAQGQLNDNLLNKLENQVIEESKSLRGQN